VSGKVPAAADRPLDSLQHRIIATLYIFPGEPGDTRLTQEAPGGYRDGRYPSEAFLYYNLPDYLSRTIFFASETEPAISR
jgi:hypothetical protein